MRDELHYSEQPTRPPTAASAGDVRNPRQMSTVDFGGTPGTGQPSGAPPAPWHERFVPGEMIAGRYRVASLLGKGGMGEVYRADDLKLGHVVALKFLPPAVSKNGAIMAALLNEVRSARQVTHPNVVRVHDIGEHNGEPFLSMEFVDGETLESLLRRIGRLPTGKAIELARQLCSGLAAIHEQGMLHRDLKPANVMIDGRGQGRITDCGLVFKGELLEGRMSAGTPGYMAPETVERRSTTAKSDIYALGLVLYELFTGRAAYEARDTVDLLRQQRSRDPDPPSRVASDLDPVVSRVIQRCLERDPAMRPPSARAVALGLPGGDPLAAALAAGETPSPELVAAGGRLGQLRVRTAALLLAAFAALFAIGAGIQLRIGLLNLVPLEKSPEVLADRSEMILKSLGYPLEAGEVGGTIDRGHRAFSYDLYEELVAQILEKDQSANRWERLRRARPAAVDFWYRWSARRFASLGISGTIDLEDPPMRPGDVSLRLSPAGQLRELTVVSRQLFWSPESWQTTPEARERPAPLPHDAGALFVAADLDPSKFTPVEATRIPAVFADARRAWIGTYPESPDEPIRVEAAWLDGKPVAFRIIEKNWQKASMIGGGTLADADDASGVAQALNLAMVITSLGGGLLLARRNIRLHRGDQRGGRVLAIAAFGAILVQVWCTADTMLFAGRTGGTHVVYWITVSASVAALYWLMYIAMEPYARRIWPESLISWNRLLGRRFSDPLVGQSVLVGIVLGALAYAITATNNLIPQWFGLPPARPMLNTESGILPLLGMRRGIGLLVQCFLGSLQFAFIFVLGLVLTRLVLRKRWAASIAFGLVQTAVWTLSGPFNWLTWVLNGLLAAVVVLTMARQGLLAIVAGTFAFNVLLAFPIPPRADVWYSTTIAVGILPLVVLAAWGTVGSVGGLGRRGSPTGRIVVNT